MKVMHSIKHVYYIHVSPAPQKNKILKACFGMLRKTFDTLHRVVPRLGAGSDRRSRFAKLTCDGLAVLRRPSPSANGVNIYR
jgi:hypothetical protein